MIPISDQTMEVIEYAMDALTLRSEVIANNVANSEVPGFKASRVAFEAELERAIGDRGPDRFGDPTVHGTGAAGDSTGNNVNLESEVVEMVKTNLLQQAMFEAFNFKSGLMRTAIRGQ